MKVTLNNVAGEIVEIRRNLPNIGLGNSTATVDHEFVADPLPISTEEFKFELEGKAVCFGIKVKIYKAFCRNGSGWIYRGSFKVPFKTLRKDLKKYYAEI